MSDRDSEYPRVESLGVAYNPRHLCRRRGHHSVPFEHRRRGPFWNRRDEYWCVTCEQLVEPLTREYTEDE